MRRQTALGEAIADAGRAMRLDPFALPVRTSVSSGGRAPGAASVLLDRHQVVIQRAVANGLPLTLTVPTSAYRGVAVRMEADATGGVRVNLELQHRDPMLSVPLALADDPADIAADWQAWGKVLGLPLLLIEADGRVSEPVERIGRLTVAAPRPRRMHSFFADRRPRFLARRKTGGVPSELIAGEELFGRE